MIDIAGMQAAALRERAHQPGGLRQFVEAFWPIVEPAAPFLPGWHLDAVCEFLEAWYRREFSNGVLNLPPGTGKPVHEDELVETPDGPRPLRDIQVGDLVMTHRGRARRVLAVHEQGELPTLELTTWCGRKLRMAPDHPVLTARGWIQAQHLVPLADVLVSVADAEDRPSTGVTEAEARWCGYMIGDGCSLYSSAGFTNQEPDALADFRTISEAMGFKVRAVQKKGCAATYLALSGPQGVHQQPSPVRLQLERFGLRKCSSYTKRIPPEILNGPLHVLANLLGAYWTCDGELSLPKAGRRGVTCCATTVNYDLAVDLQRAFLRLGISVRIRRRVSNLKTARQGDQYVSWQVVCDTRHIWRLAQLPGLCERKALRLPPASIPQTWIEDTLESVAVGAPGRCRCLTVEEDSSFVVRGIAVHNSLLVDVFFQAWVWAVEPGHKFLSCAYDLDLGTRDADKVTQIVSSDLFRRAWPKCELRKDMTARRNVWTTQGGYRFATTPEGKGLGRHFTSVSVNDPVKAQDVLDGKVADVNVALERAQRWFDGTLQTRRADPKRFGIMVTMQRLREKDLAETCLDRGYAHLCLPMRYEPSATWIRTSGGDWSGKLEQRTEPGELLHPLRYPEDVTAQLEASLGEHASAQLQQNPIPRTGGLLEEPHLRWEWVTLPTAGAYWIQVWDFAAKGTSATHSAVHGALWCVAECDQVRELLNLISDREKGAPAVHAPVAQVEKCHRYFLADEVWGHFTVPQSEQLFESVQGRPLWAKSHQRIIEAKAAGIGIIQRYERKFSGVVAFHEIDDACKALAQQDKLDRHTSNLGEWHAGRVLLPPWRATVDGVGPDAFRKELLAFPRGARDDRVDSSSMALARLTQGQALYWSQVKLLAAQRGRR